MRRIISVANWMTNEEFPVYINVLYPTLFLDVQLQRKRRSCGVTVMANS